jgi:hypothetical protein
MPKASNLTRRKERRARKTEGCVLLQVDPCSPPSSSLVGPARKVSNEDMNETSLHQYYPVVSPLTSQTKFNEDGTYRMEVATIPPELKQQRQSRLLRRSSTLVSAASTSTNSSSSTLCLKRSTGSLKRCLVDLTELVTEDASHTPLDPHSRLQVLEAQSPDAGNVGDNWGHFVDEIPPDERTPSFFDSAPYPKRRRTIKSKHDKPLRGFFLVSVEEAAKELDNLRF